MFLVSYQKQINGNWESFSSEFRHYGLACDFVAQMNKLSNYRDFKISDNHSIDEILDFKGIVTNPKLYREQLVSDMSATKFLPSLHEIKVLLVQQNELLTEQIALLKELRGK